MVRGFVRSSAKGLSLESLMCVCVRVRAFVCRMCVCVPVRACVVVCLSVNERVNVCVREREGEEERKRAREGERDKDLVRGGGGVREEERLCVQVSMCFHVCAFLSVRACFSSVCVFVCALAFVHV